MPESFAPLALAARRLHDPSGACLNLPNRGASFRPVAGERTDHVCLSWLVNWREHMSRLSLRVPIARILRTLSLVVLPVVLVALDAAPARAALVAYEPFDYTPAGSDLLGKSGS